MKMALIHITIFLNPLEIKLKSALQLHFLFKKHYAGVQRQNNKTCAIVQILMDLSGYR